MGRMRIQNPTRYKLILSEGVRDERDLLAERPAGDPFPGRRDRRDWLKTRLAAGGRKFF